MMFECGCKPGSDDVRADVLAQLKGFGETETSAGDLQSVDGSCLWPTIETASMLFGVLIHLHPVASPNPIE